MCLLQTNSSRERFLRKAGVGAHLLTSREHTFLVMKNYKNHTHHTSQVLGDESGHEYVNLLDPKGRTKSTYR